jgi:hypothetical protein
MFGFPKNIDLNKYDVVISSRETKVDFENKQLSDPDIFGEKK